MPERITRKLAPASTGAIISVSSAKPCWFTPVRGIPRARPIVADAAACTVPAVRVCIADAVAAVAAVAVEVRVAVVERAAVGEEAVTVALGTVVPVAGVPIPDGVGLLVASLCWAFVSYAADSAVSS